MASPSPSCRITGTAGNPLRHQDPSNERAAPLVSYVVVTRNRQSEVLRCLRSIREQDYPNKQIVTVDNGSTDGTPSVIREQFTEVHLLALGMNHGVSGGRNRGAANANGEICVFIDDDARFADAQATRRIVRYFDGDPKLACLAFKVCDPVTGLEDYKAIPRADKRRMQQDYPCAYFCGAGFAVRRRALLDVGMLWEPLVYGGEEIDLSYRLIDQGHRLHRTSSVVVLHLNVPTGRQRGQQSYFYARNRCWIAVRNLPWLYALSTTGLWWGYTILTSAARGETSLAARGIWDALRGLPAVLRERQPISADTVRAIKKLSGRLWY
jgi:GT2 family glycosyltransferase